MKHLLFLTLTLLSSFFVACAFGNEPDKPDSETTESTDSNMEPYKMYITVNGTTMTANMVANSSTTALKDLLKEGDITIAMHDYSNFEKVGELPKSLPQNNTQITTQPGDLILYQGKNFVIYYDKNS